MPSSSDEVAVFVDTNIDTHIAVPVSPDISIAEFKRELESLHSRCFTQLGDIKVHDLMVKRHSCFYHLPESLPIKSAFQGLKGTWFLYVVVRAFSGLDEHFSPESLTAKDVSDGQDTADSLITEAHRSKMSCSNTEIRKMELSSTKPLEDSDSEDVPDLEEQGMRMEKVNNILACRVNDHDKECSGKTEETPCIDSGRNSEFQFYRNENEQMIPSSSTMETNNVRSSMKNDNFSEVRVCASHQIAANGSFTCRLHTDSRLEGLENKPSRTTIRQRKRTSAVGKRVLIAASNIKNSGNKHRPAVCFSKTEGCSSPLYVTRSLVFEISDSDD